MFRYVFKQLKRSFITNALFCLLLTLSGTLLCISAGLWYSAHRALLDIDETITTIAVPNRVAINLTANERAQLEDLPDPAEDRHAHAYALAEAVLHAEQDIMNTIRNEIYPSGIIRMDNRRFFGAIADGITPVPLRTIGVGVEPQIAAFSGQALAAFVITCERIETSYWTNSNEYMNDGTVYQINEAIFHVDEVLHLSPVHPEPKYIRIGFIKNHDGSAPFEAGKQYAAAGRYERWAAIGNLEINIPDVETEPAPTGKVRSNSELNELMSSYIWRFLFSDDMFPMDIAEIKLSREPTAEDGWYSFIEIKNNLNETKASDEWRKMDEFTENAKISSKSFQVLTTDNPNSLLRFNQTRNLYAEGRSFNSRESNEGTRVCLVSMQFADQNDLNIGDTIPLQLFNAVIGARSFGYMESEGSNYTTRTLWIPSHYQTGLEISEPIDFTIIGIFNTIGVDRGEYAILPSTVIIPNNSFSSVEGEPESLFDTSLQAPLITDSMIVPNGTILETRTMINSVADGYGHLFRFFDQGFGSLRMALNNLRFGMTWILLLSTTGWVAILIIFLVFYVARKKKEAALLYATGINKSDRFKWIFSQCAFLIIFALGISVALSLPLYSDILDIAGGAAQEFSDSLRDLTLSDAADSGLRNRIPLHRSPTALLVTAVTGALVTLFIAGMISIRSVTFKTMNDKGGDD